MYDSESQANPPEAADVRLEALREKVGHTVTVLEENKKGITRWFFKGLAALNLVLASIVTWVFVVPYLIQTQ